MTSEVTQAAALINRESIKQAVETIEHYLKSSSLNQDDVNSFIFRLHLFIEKVSNSTPLEKKYTIEDIHEEARKSRKQALKDAISAVSDAGGTNEVYHMDAIQYLIDEEFHSSQEVTPSELT
jgi:hypothetical protein